MWLDGGAGTGGAVIVPDGGCPPPLTDCGGFCVNLQTDPAHCGGCNQACASGQSCETGQCAACQHECSAGQQKCADGANAYQVCTDVNGCFKWGDPVACAAGQTCDMGACVPGGTECTDECTPAGARQCATDGYDVCNDHDLDGCLEWGGYVACPAGQSCDPATGACVDQGQEFDVEFLDLQPLHGQTDAGWGPVLTDVVQHCPVDQWQYYHDPDSVTAAHETTHGINAHIRNTYAPAQRVNGFYLLENRAVLVNEPNIRKSDVASYVPASMRGMRYDLYIVGMTDWDDTPLYIWDEWVAYTNGTVAGVDQVRQGLWNAPIQDVCVGPLEFIGYTIALGLAVEELDPTYFTTYDQFRAFMGWNMRRSMNIFRECRVLPEFLFQGQDDLFNSLASGTDTAGMRDFLTRTFGDAFVQEILAPL
jgi:hypothetical protein